MLLAPSQLAELTDRKYPKLQAEWLVNHGWKFEAGHAAIHRSHEPSQGELIAALEIVEGIIETLYINPDKSRWVSKMSKNGDLYNNAIKGGTCTSRALWLR